jgi:lysozyme
MAKKKQHTAWWKALVATLLFCAVAFTVVHYHKQLTRYYYKAYRLYKRYKHHNSGAKIESIPFPDGYGIHGIDISHYQEYINWDNLRTRSDMGDTIAFSFVYMKATEGVWKEDVAFDANWDDAHDHHITCGAYHYFLPDKDVQRQAKNFISSVTLRTGDLPPVIDIEETRGKSKQEIVTAVKTMSDLLQAQYGVKPILYSNISFIEDYLSDDFPDHYFWVAHYYEEQLEISDEIKWLFWQHSDRAMLFNSDQHVDVNVFNGNQIELRNILVEVGPKIRSAQ